MAPKQITDPFIIANMKNMIRKFLFLTRVIMSVHRLARVSFFVWRASSCALAEGKIDGLYLNSKIIGMHVAVAMQDATNMKCYSCSLIFSGSSSSF